jgi:hypothetical protein
VIACKKGVEMLNCLYVFAHTRQVAEHRPAVAVVQEGRHRQPAVRGQPPGRRLRAGGEAEQVVHDHDPAARGCPRFADEQGRGGVEYAPPPVGRAVRQVAAHQ